MEDKVSKLPSLELKTAQTIDGAESAGAGTSKPKNKNGKYVSIREFGEYFGMHKQHISKLIRERKICAYKMFGTTSWRIPVEEIEKYEKKSRIQTEKDIFNY